MLSVAGLGLLAFNLTVQADDGYRVLDTTQLMGSGGTDYVYVDNDGRRVYVPRGGNTLVFDLDSHKYIGTVTNAGGHGVAVDPNTHHGVVSGNPPSLFDTETLQKIKDIDGVKSRPDGIIYEPATGKIFILSHASPSVTIIDPKDGAVAGSIDIGGAIEQAQADGQGKVFADIEDEKKIAVIDAKSMKLVSKIDLGDTAGDPGGLGLDVKNHILFAMCAEPSVCVVVNADNGKVLATLPIGNGTDSGGFNPNTMEAFSSQRDGTLTIIKESSPTDFAVEQTVKTKTGARTSSLDTKNNRIVLITVERPPQTNAAPAMASTTGTTNQPGGAPRSRHFTGPGMLDVMFVGK